MIFQIPGSGDLKGHNIIAKPNVRHSHPNEVTE
jgi:hypothetical protein